MTKKDSKKIDYDKAISVDLSFDKLVKKMVATKVKNKEDKEKGTSKK